MSDTDAINQLLARAGMLMEDASAQLVTTNEPPDLRAAVLRTVVEQLNTISRDVAERLRR